MKTCLNRLLGICKDCSINYDPHNRPNNYDCHSYHETNMIMINIKEGEDKNALDRKTSPENP